MIQRNRRTPYQNVVDFVLTNYGDISYLYSFLKDNKLDNYTDFYLFSRYKLNYINNDVSMLPTLSSSFNGTLYQVWAKHQGGASSSFAYTGTEFYHSGSTQ